MHNVIIDYRNHPWGSHGCSHAVCLCIHWCLVKWDGFSSVILVVERQNKEHEFIQNEHLSEHENFCLENVRSFCLFYMHTCELLEDHG